MNGRGIASASRKGRIEVADRRPGVADRRLEVAVRRLEVGVLRVEVDEIPCRGVVFFFFLREGEEGVMRQEGMLGGIIRGDNEGEDHAGRARCQRGLLGRASEVRETVSGTAEGRSGAAEDKN